MIRAGRRVKGVMIAVGGFAALLVLGATLLDVGEIVTLETRDETGRLHETHLWIAYLDRTPYLRASDGESHWIARLRADSEVRIEMRGREQRFRAVAEDDASVRERLNRAMAQKYGLADDLWGLVSDARRTVAIRLEALQNQEDGAGARGATH